MQVTQMPDTGAGVTLVVVNVAALKLGLLKLIEHLLFHFLVNMKFNR
jgi:hypothetical protein